MTANATAEQSALRKTSAEFCDTTKAHGWVSKSGSMLAIAQTLVNGESETSPAPKNYAASIGADSNAPSLIFARIASDAQSAQAGLSLVTAEAETLLASSDIDAASRVDVMSYERALVDARKAYRAFAKASQVASKRTTPPVTTKAALEAYSAEIDRARKTADRLANRYTGQRAASS